jgi:hypothetical protein
VACPPWIGGLERPRVQRHSGSAEMVGVEVVTNVSREPSTDELASVEWWNSLSEPRRADWLQLADSTKPAEAWAEYKRRTAEGQPEAIGTI